MKQFPALLAFVLLAFSSAARAQLENFATIPTGSYATFMGFGGVGSFSRIGTLGLLHVDNGVIFPPNSVPNAMFGRGVDVRIRLLQPRKQFQGVFRSVPVIALPPTMVNVRFLLTPSMTWTPWFMLPVNPLGYSPGAWNVGAMFGQGFVAVELVGNGSLPGYVGMDDLVLL